MSIIIKEVNSKRELKKFVMFGIKMYSNHPYAAPPLLMDDMTVLSREKNPSFEVCDAAYFIAIRDGEMAGRVAAIINHKANEHWNNKHARFGWLDMIDDIEVTRALLSTAEKWALERGMDSIQGPAGFTDFDREGMLVWGFDKPGTMATNYNFPYYPEHMEELGYAKDIDWKEYNVQIPAVFPEKHFRIADIVKAKHKLTPKKFHSSKEIVKQYGSKIFDLLNICYKDLYGFSMLSPAQMDFYIKTYLTFVRLDLICVIVNENDEVVAVGISMPSMTKALQKIKGKLFPTGWFYMLKALKGKSEVVDLYLMAVRPDYQPKGASALLFSELIPQYAKSGFKYAETNPELETNHKVSTLWDSFETTHVKTRRAYSKKLK
jgi:GNAT superfamily N-acetyltransferase